LNHDNITSEEIPIDISLSDTPSEEISQEINVSTELNISNDNTSVLTEIEDKDTILNSMTRVFQKLHAVYYKEYEDTGKLPDIREIVDFLKGEVLSGCKILFSGVFPLENDPSKEILWRKCEMFGAECHRNLSKKITHIVATKAGTSKMNEAIKGKLNLYIVHLRWIEESIANWQLLHEKNYPIDGMTVCPHKPPILQPSLPKFMLDLISDDINNEVNNNDEKDENSDKEDEDSDKEDEDSDNSDDSKDNILENIQKKNNINNEENEIDDDLKEFQASLEDDFFKDL